MANVFDSSREHLILKDERFLYPDFVPEKLPFRDKEVSELVFCLKPASEGKKPTNAFVFGKPGTGKTVTARFVLQELEEFSDRVKCLYINCFQSNSRHAIIYKASNFFGHAVPERGLGSDEIFLRFVSVLRTKKLTPIIVFDEAEQLLRSEDMKKLLYDFSRLSEQHKVFCGMIFVSNDEFFLANVDERVRSSLQASTIAFEPYAPPELKEILKERAKYAFFDDVLDDEVIPLCAAHAAKNGGDARIAIDVLLKGARLAEKENSKKVSVKHLRAAFAQEKPVKFEIKTTLSEQEQLILAFLADKEVESGEVYSALKKKFAERTLRSAFAELEQKKLIVAREIRKGRGVTRMLSKPPRAPSG